MNALAQSIFQPASLSHLPAINHGRSFEDTAIQKFEEMAGKKTIRCGLFIDPSMPFLGATPDRLVEGEEAIVEVKCPYVGKDSKIMAGKFFPFFEISGGETLKLKENHSYFYQIQGQLRIARKEFCYFVVFTHSDLHVEKIYYDPAFFERMLPLLRQFYESHYLQFIVDSL